MCKYQIRWFYFGSLSYSVTANSGSEFMSIVQKVSRNFKDLDFEKFWNDANLDGFI